MMLHVAGLAPDLPAALAAMRLNFSPPCPVKAGEIDFGSPKQSSQKQPASRVGYQIFYKCCSYTISYASAEAENPQGWGQGVLQVRPRRQRKACQLSRLEGGG